MLLTIFSHNSTFLLPAILLCCFSSIHFYIPQRVGGTLPEAWYFVAMKYNNSTVELCIARSKIPKLT
jgi:hypothetical protein